MAMAAISGVDMPGDRDRNRDHIIGCRKAEILQHDALSSLRDIEHREDRRKAAGIDRIGGRLRHIHRPAGRQRRMRHGQCAGIIEPITDHQHFLVMSCQPEQSGARPCPAATLFACQVDSADLISQHCGRRLDPVSGQDLGFKARDHAGSANTSPASSCS